MPGQARVQGGAGQARVHGGAASQYGNGVHMFSAGRYDLAAVLRHPRAVCDVPPLGRPTGRRGAETVGWKTPLSRLSA